MRTEGRRPIATAAVTGGALLALALPAHALSATRYASPSGTGSSCSQAVPCGVTEAVNSAGPTDEVIVKAGTYNLGNTPLTVAGGMNVHGAAGEAMPQLNFGTPGFSAISVSGSGRIARLRVRVTGPLGGVLLNAGTLGEQLDVRVTDLAACAVQLATLRSSACTGSGANSEGVIASGDGPVILRNVTAVGGSYGLDAFAGNAGENLVVDAVNSVFSGGTADIATFPSGGGASADVDAASSNFATVDESGDSDVTAPGTGANQTAEPGFVNASAGDFHQLPGSPTRNAGTADPSIGTFDFEGDPRLQGTAPDIGADEYDDTAPETTIVSGPKKKTRKRKATFRFRADDPGASFECKLDGRAFSPCSSPAAFKKLRVGRHRLQVRAEDALGNLEATPAMRTWKVKKKKKRKK